MISATIHSELADQLSRKDEDVGFIDHEIWDLEWSNVDKGSLPEIWEEVERRLGILERCYVPGADFKKPQEIIRIWRQLIGRWHTNLTSELAFRMVAAVYRSKLLEKYFNQDKDFAYTYRNIRILQDPDRRRCAEGLE